VDVEIRFESLAAATGLIRTWDEEILQQGVVLDPGAGSPAGMADFAAPRGRFLVAYNGADPVACAGLRPIGDEIGEVKRLYVSSAARRQGIARRLLSVLESEARSLGYRRLRLDTNPGNDPSIALFREAGFHEIPDYNGNELAAHWFEKELTQMG
jgi:ribosomal protein S18 acetylase RimI-like enzyme